MLFIVTSHTSASLLLSMKLSDTHAIQQRHAADAN
jgi:hypothetical protein